jgi:hypothetical protein
VLSALIIFLRNFEFVNFGAFIFYATKLYFSGYNKLIGVVEKIKAEQEKLISS